MKEKTLRIHLILCCSMASDLAQLLDERWYRNYTASRRRYLIKQAAVQYLGGKCAICGYDKTLAALEVHHRDPQEKDFVISATLNWDRIVPELDKCVLLCANCHREVHDGWHPEYLDIDDDEYDFG